MELQMVLQIVGGVFVAYKALIFLMQILNGVRAFILPALGVKKDLRKFGKWAVVTGCTDGIGRSFANQLAEKGINVVLISRTKEKLENLAAEIRSAYRVDTKIITLDFSGGPEIYVGLEAELSDLDIGILVNNVGVSHYPEFFTNMKREDCWKMINVNDLSVIMMTHVVLPGMVSRGKGLVLNISSGAGIEPRALLSVYSASKAFVDFFSHCIGAEYAGKGIISECVQPLYVATKMSRIRKANLLVPGPDDFVRQTLGTVGVQSRTNGCWSHALQAYIAGLLPAFVRDKLSWNLMTARRRAVLKKLQKQGEKSGHQE